jgi:hypothetical protein
MKIGLWYLILVAVIAASVALFEIWGTAHFHVAWGAPLPPDTVWGKPLIQKAPFNLVGFQLLTRYHFFMFGVIVPASVLILGHQFRHMTANPPSRWFGWLIFTIAGTMGVMVLEDFLFFAFSTILGKPYPRALERLFQGEASWHPWQISFFGLFKLPVGYIWVPLVARLLLWLVSRFRL